MINEVRLLGRLGKDPDVRVVGDNKKVARLRLATSRYYNDSQGQRQEITDWHSVVCWGKLAEVAEQYLATGKQIYIAGYLQTRSYEDNDGIRRYSVEVVANDLLMLGGAGGGEKSTSQATSQKPAVQKGKPKASSRSPFPDEDLPFPED